MLALFTLHFLVFLQDHQQHSTNVTNHLLQYAQIHRTQAIKSSVIQRSIYR